MTAPVETRLTAEQFWREYYKDDPNFPLSQAACTFAKAFRDKSEAGLREEIERLEYLLDSHLDTTWRDLADANQTTATKALTLVEELRAKLDQLLSALGCTLGGVESALQVIDAKNAAIEAAEAEAAALRERERWIRVEEKLPEANGEYQIAEKYLEVSTADFFADDKTWKTVRCYGVDAEERELYNVTHWKALSAAPETTK